MINLNNRKIIYRWKWFDENISNMTYCHFLVDGKTLSDMFYWRVNFERKLGYDYTNVGFYHTIDDVYDLDDIKHYIHVYDSQKVFHVYVLQDVPKVNYWNDNKELKIRLITIDEKLIVNKKEKEEKREKYLI